MNPFKKLIKKHHVFLTVPLAVLSFFLIVPVLRMADPTAAAFDAGVFQIPVFSASLFFFYLAIAWLAFRIIFGNHYRFLTTEMKSNFQNLTSWQKLKLSYYIYFLLVALLVMLSKSTL